jgi:hypothetical protein
VKHGQGRGTRERGARPARLAWTLALVLAPALPWAGPAVAQDVPPGGTYRTLEAARVRVTYAEGLGSLAVRAAASAERALDRLEEDFLPGPEGPIDLLITDHADISNGVAYVFPSNRITILAHPPLEGLALSHFDEWIDLVVTHELVHTVHLDHAGALGSIVRSVFGRPPWTWPAFPGYTASPFGIEGVAVVAESRHTTAGRMEGTHHLAIARAQARGRGLESVSEALGHSPDWPGAGRRYVFGSLFFGHLTDEYGTRAVADYFAALADQWIPYRLDAAAVRAFGLPFTELWDGWVEGMVATADRLEARVDTEPRGHPPSEVEVLTEAAREGLHPAPRPGSPSAGFAYVRADGRSDTRLVLSEDGSERTLTRWNSLDSPRWTSDGDLLVTQLEFVDRYRIYRDLYRVGVDGGVTRLTSGMRVVHADPHPSDRSMVAVLADGSTNRLAVLDASGAEARTLVPAVPGVLWSYPRWSPDGALLAVARRTPNGRSAIVVMDPRGTELGVLAEGSSQQTAPAWAPDGRTVVWASDRSGVPNLFSVRVRPGESPWHDPVRQVSDLVSAAAFPSVDQDGRWIYFSLLGPEGWDVARLPYDPSRWEEPAPVDPRFSDGVEPSTALVAGLAQAGGGAQDPPARAYSPLATLLPRYWVPVRTPAESSLERTVVGAAWGARTSAYDLLGRHAYTASAAASFDDSPRRWEWSGRYTWSGLENPALFVETAQAWRARAPLVFEPNGPPPAVPDTLLTAVRERWVGAGLEMRRARARNSTSLALAGRLVSEERRVFTLDRAEPDGVTLVRPDLTLAEARLSVGWSSARWHAFSLSREDGLAASLALRQRWDLTVPDSLAGMGGIDGGLRDAVLAVQAYEGFRGPGFANHVVAVRAAAGRADGPGARGGHFAVGGGRGEAFGFLGGTIGSGARTFPVRGFAPGTLRGRSAWSVSTEWRFPIAVVREGWGAWPLFLDRVAGSVFLDVGGASDPAGGDARWHGAGSAGVEVAVFHSRFFQATDVLRVGVAVPFHSTRVKTPTPSIHVEMGWSF